MFGLIKPNRNQTKKTVSIQLLLEYSEYLETVATNKLIKPRRFS